MNNRILRLNDVKDMTGLSRSTIYAEIARGHFPRQIQLTGARSVGWHESAVVHWIETREVGGVASNGPGG
jgi:prophage regulatory protein